MQGPFLRKYGVQTTINFDLYEIDGIDLKVDAAHAAGDTKIMKDEAAEANTTNGFTDEGQTYSIVLTATEMQAARIKIIIVDAATKVWLDTTVCVETYGNASAMHAFDLDTADGSNLTEAGGTGDHLTAINLPNQTMDITGNLSGSVGSVTGHTAQTADHTANIASILTDTGTTLENRLIAIEADTDVIDDGTSGLVKIASDVAAILVDSNELQTDWTNAGRLDAILDAILAMLDDARGEPAQGAPPVNPDAMTKLDYIYKAWRNKKTATATAVNIYDDAGTTIDHKKTISDDGTTYSDGEIVTGP